MSSVTREFGSSTVSEDPKARSSQCAFPTIIVIARMLFYKGQTLVRSTKGRLMLLTRNDIVVALIKTERRKGSRIKRPERERSPMSTIVEIHETYCVDIYI